MIKFLLGFLLASIILAGNESEDKRIIIPINKRFGRAIASTQPKYNAIIRIAEPDGRSFCTAFVIDPSFAITAAHCINDNGNLRKNPMVVINDQGVNTHVVVQAAGMATRSDFGLIIGDFSSFKIQKTELKNFGFNDKDRFVTCGFPYGQKEMVCNDFHPLSNEVFAVTGKSYIVPGMSGGPVINKTTGAAVGINSYACDKDCFAVYPLQGFLGAFDLE